MFFDVQPFTSESAAPSQLAMQLEGGNGFDTGVKHTTERAVEVGGIDADVMFQSVTTGDYNGHAIGSHSYGFALNFRNGKLVGFNFEYPNGSEIPEVDNHVTIS